MLPLLTCCSHIFVNTLWSSTFIIPMCDKNSTNRLGVSTPVGHRRCTPGMRRQFAFHPREKVLVLYPCEVKGAGPGLMCDNRSWWSTHIGSQGSRPVQRQLRLRQLLQLVGPSQPGYKRRASQSIPSLTTVIQVLRPF